MTEQERCPTCGEPVKVVSSDEGTSHYESVAGALLSKALDAADMPCSSPIRAEILSEIRSDLGEKGER